MADYGAVFYDASGNVLSNISTRLSRVLGIQAITTASGGVTHAGFSTGTPWYILIPRSAGTSYVAINQDVTFSGTTLSWSFAGGAPNHTLIYGVY